MEMYPDQEEQAAAGRRKIRIPWLALAVLSWLSAGPVCIAVVEMATHHLLTVRAQAFIELLFQLIAVVFVLLQFRQMAGERGNAVTAGRMFAGLRALLFTLTTGILLKHMIQVLLGYDLQLLFAAQPVIATLMIVVTALLALFLILFLYWSIHVWFCGERTGFLAAFLSLVRHPLSFLLLAAGGVGVVAILFLCGLLAGILGERSIASFLALRILAAFLVWLLAAWVLRSVADREPENDEEESEPAIPIISGVIGLALFLLVFLGSESGNLFYRTTDQVFGEVDAWMNAGTAQFQIGQTASADTSFRKALQLIDALRAASSEEGVQMNYKPADTSPMTEHLYLLSGGSADTMGEKIRTGVFDTAYYPVLLSWYAEKETLTEEEQKLRDEMLTVCIAKGYADWYPNADWFQKNALAVSKRIKDYENIQPQIRMISLKNKAAAAGGANREIVEEALQEAEAHPENAYCQYVAMNLGADYRVDDATHYDRTVEAAKRYDALTEGSGSDDGKLLKKRMVASIIRGCYRYEEAIPYFKQIAEITGTAADQMQLARCYLDAEQYAECIETANAAADLAEQEEGGTKLHSQALYLMGIAAVKTADADASILAAERLADELEAAEAPTYEQESMLYQVIQYLTISDSARWTDFQHAVYDSLTEEQKADIEGHPLLAHYMKAMYAYFMQKKNEDALAEIDAVLAIHEDLAMANYLKGSILFSAKNFDEAEKCLLAANQYHPDIPAVLYALANVYDGKQDYQTAYTYSKKVKAILPEQDHGEDIYGISYHNSNLLEALEWEIGR